MSRLQHVFALLRVCAPTTLDNDRGREACCLGALLWKQIGTVSATKTHVHQYKGATHLNVLLLGQRGEEPAHPRVASTVGVDDFLFGEWRDRVLRDDTIVGHNRVVRTLGYDDSPFSGPVLLYVPTVSRARDCNAEF